MRKVVKFGGSSLASAEQFKKVGEIIHADKERRFVVPSAPGKRNADDTKVTDMLYDCYDLAEAGKDFKAQLKAIKERYQEIIDGLGLKLAAVLLKALHHAFPEIQFLRVPALEIRNLPDAQGLHDGGGALPHAGDFRQGASPLPGGAHSSRSPVSSPSITPVRRTATKSPGSGASSAVK